MMIMSADEALAFYEAARHRLPPATSPAHRIREIEALTDVADEFDVFLLDAFGVLNVGDAAIPGVAKRVAALRGMGKRALVVSNAASVPVSELCEKYRRLGFDFAEADIVSSRATLAASMNGQSGLCWGVMAPDAAQLDDFGGIDTVPLLDDAAAYKRAEGFLLVGSGSWTEARQELLETALADRPRPVLVANPDIVAPREAGLSAEPGLFAHRLADRTGVEPQFYGKPFANIFDLAFARLGTPLDRSRILMVGDSLHTDILGAQAAGIASALVTGYGFFAQKDVSGAIQSAGIFPDIMLVRP